jgi:hypothetical protein
MLGRELLQMGMNILSESTEKQTAVRRLRENGQGFSIISPEVILRFIAKKVSVSKISVGVIGTYSTAICHVIDIIGGKLWGNHPMIARAVRAVKRMKPVEARYCELWSAKVLWEYIAENRMILLSDS